MIILGTRWNTHLGFPEASTSSRNLWISPCPSEYVPLPRWMSPCPWSEEKGGDPPRPWPWCPPGRPGRPCSPSCQPPPDMLGGDSSYAGALSENLNSVLIWMQRLQRPSWPSTMTATYNITQVSFPVDHITALHLGASGFSFETQMYIVRHKQME